MTPDAPPRTQQRRDACARRMGRLTSGLRTSNMLLVISSAHELPACLAGSRHGVAESSSQQCAPAPALLACITPERAARRGSPCAGGAGRPSPLPGAPCGSPRVPQPRLLHCSKRTPSMLRPPADSACRAADKSTRIHTSRIAPARGTAYASGALCRVSAARSWRLDVGDFLTRLSGRRGPAKLPFSLAIEHAAVELGERR